MTLVALYTTIKTNKKMCIKKTEEEKIELKNAKQEWRRNCKQKYGNKWTKSGANKLTKKGRQM